MVHICQVCSRFPKPSPQSGSVINLLLKVFSKLPGAGVFLLNLRSFLRFFFCKISPVDFSAPLELVEAKKEL